MVDEHLAQGQQWLEELLRLLGVSSSVLAQEEELDRESEAYWLTIDHAHLSEEQIQVLIGEQGETIDAIQYLANTILNLGLGPDQQRPVTIELDRYRAHRQAELHNLAEQVAEQVRETGQEVEMRSLSSAERRQVHTFLKTAADLETESRGQEPDRRLVVRQRFNP
ncbi:MAG: RNA-binding protein [Chloroflexaceae bacterium]|nr:RNA-binding protein [Chloroflexaceae bacterium]